MENRQIVSKPLKILLIIASLVIIIAGIRAIESVFIPILLSLFISLILSPILFWASKKSIPNWLSISVVAVGLIMIFLVIFTVIGTSIQSIIEEIPLYQTSLEQRWNDFTTFVSNKGIDLGALKSSKLIDAKQAMSFVMQILNSMSGLIEDGIIIYILVIFMMLATFKFPAKIRAMSSGKDTLKEFDLVIKRINQYILLKTIISLITGILVAVFLWILGINNAIFFGFIAFIMNYIPNIGSILAAIPVVFMAILQYDLSIVLVVIIGFVVINMVMGNAIEPRIMGKSIELSTVMIFASLLFWGWMLGTVGMFLSVPITIIIKIAAEHYEGTRWLSILLGPDN